MEIWGKKSLLKRRELEGMKFSVRFGSFLSSTSKRQNLMVNWTSRGDATGKKSDKKKTWFGGRFPKKIEKANFDIPRRPP